MKTVCDTTSRISSRRAIAGIPTVAFAALTALGLLPGQVLLPVPGADGLAAQEATTQAPAPTVEVGEFDFGKMWTFEYPPVEHFQSTYGVEATPEWFEKARMAALRIPGCSASFVSPNGLVVTNHHCARGAIASVSQEGENLLDDGFYAETLEDERPLPNYYADQLLAALDVTDEVEDGVVIAGGGEGAREVALEAVENRLRGEYGEDIRVQFVPLYNGGRTSAYVIRRYTDVRLVAAVELELGFFGGDPDNFTYPRYALDYTFYRVYDKDGEPLETDFWFEWGDGVEEGEPIFMVGNPGPTNRLLTVAQLEYQRDFLVPGRQSFFATRLQALREAYAADPVTGERLGLRNRAFSLSNSLKAYTGRLEALQDPQILARKAAAETQFVEAAGEDPALGSQVRETLGRISQLQERKRRMGDLMNAFYLVGNTTYGSRALVRALRVMELGMAARQGGGDDVVQSRLDALLGIEDHPGDLEEELLRLRLQDLVTYLGEDSPTVQQVLGGRSPEGAAAALLQNSVLGSQPRLQEAVAAAGTWSAAIPQDDPVMGALQALLPEIAEYEQSARLTNREESELDAELGRLRFQVFGTRIAPDATSSPRITDGVVMGYEYNGTRAPSHTTLFGMYDRYFSHQGTSQEWTLPERWVPVPRGLDLNTSLNFVSTADSYGGNSGSPALTRDLEIVGLNFDRNIEGLSRDFIYLPARGRNVMVDVRAIRHTLDVVYDADRVVLEIDTGRLVESEAEADRIRAGG